MGLTRLDVPRPAWPSGPLPALVSALASWALGLTAGLLGIFALQALGAGTGDLWGLAAAPLGVVAGAGLGALLWPARLTVRLDGDTVRAGRLRLPAGTGELEVSRETGTGGEVYTVHWRGPGADTRPCAAGYDPAIIDAYAEGVARVGGYSVRWHARRPATLRTRPDPTALARAVRLTRPAPDTVALRPRGPGWRELLLGSLVLWAVTGAAVAVAYPFAPGPLGFGETLLLWEGASTLLVVAYVAAPMLVALEVVASPAGLFRCRRVLGVRLAGVRRVGRREVAAVSLARRTRWQVFAATGSGAVGLGCYTLRVDAEAVRQALLAALEGEAGSPAGGT